MTLDSILAAIGSKIGKQFIAYKNVSTHPTIKALKVMSIKLYVFKEGKATELLEVSQKISCPDKEIDSRWEYLENKLLADLYASK